MKALVILTITYPDPFLENEIPHLASSFDKIYILPQNSQRNQIFGNVEVVSIFSSLNSRRTWMRLMINFIDFVRVFLYSLQYPTRRNYIKYHRSFAGYFLNEVQKVSALKRFILSNNLQDALFYDYWLVDATIAMALLKRQGLIKRSFARVHGFDLYDERQFEGCVSFREYRVKYLDAVFAISEHGLKYMQERLPERLRHKMRLSRLGVKDPGVPIEKPRIKGCDYLIVTCARLIPLKRMRLVAEVLQRTRLNISWVHFGDGPARTELEEAVRNLPENVTVQIKGNVSNDDILAFYKRFHVDLFVSLSESEGIPVSMMEAISFGIPVLACDLNGIPEIVNDTTGKLIRVNAGIDEILFEVEQTLLQRRFDRRSIYQYYKQEFDARHNYRQFVNEIHQFFNLSPLAENSVDAAH